MRRPINIILGFVLGAGLAAASDQPPASASLLRLLLSEVQAGTMASEQYCALVFADRRIHFEKATRKMGKDKDRKVYESQLSEGDWNALNTILDDKGLRELRLPQGVPPLVIEDAHTIAISISRDTKYQNMEFLDNKSRKPYEARLKPLLGWWKSQRSGHMTASTAAPDPKCSLDNAHGVFSQ
ncbi:MAG: hypothetical protein HY010_03735 [Acidobacteria bacterium]|nr:hypothetical protein [Acidobacteriota bacterium]